MLIADLIFYLLAATMTMSALMVIFMRNPVHSVLFLILAFFNAAGLFILLGAEFLAMLVVIVYVGAVAVLFLFVVMMLDIDFVELREGVLQYMPVGALVGAILLVELFLVFSTGVFRTTPHHAPAHPITDGVTNTEAIGRILYTDYIFYFQMAGAILLVAMIGAIVLTLHKRDNPRGQDITAQNMRDRDSAIEIVEVKSGEGLGGQDDGRS